MSIMIVVFGGIDEAAPYPEQVAVARADPHSHQRDIRAHACGACKTDHRRRQDAMSAGATDMTSSIKYHGLTVNFPPRLWSAG